MKNQIQLHTDNGKTTWHCPNCNNYNSSDYYRLGDLITCQSCQARFLLDKSVSHSVTYDTIWKNKSDKIILRKAVLWKCPICLRSNDYPDPVNIGDTLQCYNCKNSISVVKKEKGTRMFTFIIKGD